MRTGGDRQRSLSTEGSDMTNPTRRSTLLMPLAAIAASSLPAGAAFGQKKYGPGVTDTEIKIGQTLPYSGPASAYGQIGRAEAAYFKYLNERGGINGRKINLISLDDGFSPPKAVEQVRRLVEQDEVAFMFNVLGTPINLAVRGYLNQRKIPHIFNAAGSMRFADPAGFPWSMGWQPTLYTEAGFYAKHLMTSHPNAKVGVLYQDDDFGKEMLTGLKDALGAKANTMVVGAESFQATDPTVDSQLVKLKGQGADALMLFTYSKQAAQAIRKISDIGWKPDTYLHLGSASIGATLTPAGLDRSVGIKTAGFMKDATDPQWANDPFMRNWLEWMKKYMPDANIADSLNLAGYAYAQTLEQVLRQCGDDLTRENIMRQAANLKDYRNEALLPGSLINTSPTDYRVIEYMKLQRFNGKVWEFV
jgi:branched-chain amino acid transport system substrate-binding protein